MRVIEIKEFGAPEMLVPNTRPDLAAPAAGSGEVLIKVLAAGINRPDVLQRKGHYPVPAGASDIPGLEVAGEIIGGDLSHADNAFGLKLGDKVCALVQGGGYADLCTAPIAQCLPYPTGFSDQEAAALPETFYTVWSNVFMRSDSTKRSRRVSLAFRARRGSRERPSDRAGDRRRHGVHRVRVSWWPRQ